MNTIDNWHLKLTNDQRCDLYKLLDFVSVIRDSTERFPVASIFAQDILNCLATIIPDDPK
jgi:hypothetical protein